MLLQGKKALIMGLANNRSIAYGIASCLKAQGARLAFNYVGDAIKKRVEPLSEELGGEFTFQCDVCDDAQIQAAADLVKKDLAVDAGLSVYVDGKLTTPTDVNGKGVDVFAADGTTYLPVRAMSNALGAQISYDADGYKVYVDTAKTDDKAADYLKTYFGIAPMTGTVTTAAFALCLGLADDEEALTADSQVEGSVCSRKA